MSPFIIKDGAKKLKSLFFFFFLATRPFLVLKEPDDNDPGGSFPLN